MGSWVLGVRCWELGAGSWECWVLGREEGSKDGVVASGNLGTNYIYLVRTNTVATGLLALPFVLLVSLLRTKRAALFSRM